MDDKSFNSILKRSNMDNFEVSGNSGTKKFVSFNQDNDFIQSSPSLEELQKKFFGSASKTGIGPVIINQHDRTDQEPDDDVDMRIIKNKDADAGIDSFNIDERTIIASKDEGLLGEQG